MASARLRKLAGTVYSEYNLLKRQSSALLIATRSLSNKSRSLGEGDTVDKSDEPIKFSSSKAQAWRAQQTRSGNFNHDEPWYQPYVIIASLSVFMIYFFILREENDIDQRLSSSLYDHIEGLEEQQIEMAIEYNREHGISTKELVARLKELRGE